MDGYNSIVPVLCRNCMVNVSGRVFSVQWKRSELDMTPLSECTQLVEACKHLLICVCPSGRHLEVINGFETKVF